MEIKPILHNKPIPQDISGESNLLWKASYKIGRGIWSSRCTNLNVGTQKIMRKQSNVTPLNDHNSLVTNFKEIEMMKFLTNNSKEYFFKKSNEDQENRDKQ